MSATNSELDAKILALDAKRDNAKKDHELRTIGITVTDFGDIEQAPVKKHLSETFSARGNCLAALDRRGAASLRWQLTSQDTLHGDRTGSAAVSCRVG